MRALVGQQLGGATLTAFEELERGRAVIGDAVWGPNQLLRDLELRLGCPHENRGGADSESLRVARWAARMAVLAPLARFYSKSFAVDALGTALAMLRLRDSLVEAGWDGQIVSSGGARLNAIAELEGMVDPPLPLGTADRLTAVLEQLTARKAPTYSELIVDEPPVLWSTRWQAIFRELKRAGTRVSSNAVSLGGASANSDLGRVQAALKSDGFGKIDALEGDGSFVVLTAETTWEAARTTAAILGALHGECAVVVRGGEVSALDNGLAVHGLATQGWRSSSPWRAALQVLPLAIELAFEPKDPYRVLELLTLPVGPFQGLVGRHLARALAQSPGIGSPSWEKTKLELSKIVDSYAERAPSREATSNDRERSAQLLGRVAEWLEQRGADVVVGASKAELLAVTERVRAWLISRIAAAPGDATLLAAARHTGALRLALESDPRSTLNLVEVRRIAESILAAGTDVRLIRERAGRIDHVDSPAGLGVSREVVVWWHFVAVGGAAPGLPWRTRELAALSAAGIHFPDPKARLANQATSWHRAVFAATKRLVLVMPQSCAGTKLAPHPLWDEIVARANLSDSVRARIELSAHRFLNSSSTLTLLERPTLELLEPAALPGGHQEWAVSARHMVPIDHFSPSSLNALLGCPLQWVLRYRAGLNAGGHALPPLYMLNGTLGHRLVEQLYGKGAFDLSDAELETHAGLELDQLFVREGSILLRAGMAFERSQLRRQLVRSVLVLARALRNAGLRIVAVEKPIEVVWRGVKLVGSIDLLVTTTEGIHAIIDMKWGIAGYRKLLELGEALQLAVYAFATATEHGDSTLPDAGYFSLKQSKLFGLSSALLPNAEVVAGPTLGQTWKKIEAAVDETDRLVMSGRFPVTGVRRSVPLLTAIGVPERARADHFALTPESACKYCSFDAVCGRRWEANQ